MLNSSTYYFTYQLLSEYTLYMALHVILDALKRSNFQTWHGGFQMGRRTPPKMRIIYRCNVNRTYLFPGAVSEKIFGPIQYGVKKQYRIII